MAEIFQGFTFCGKPDLGDVELLKGVEDGDQYLIISFVRTFDDHLQVRVGGFQRLIADRFSIPPP